MSRAEQRRKTRRGRRGNNEMHPALIPAGFVGAAVVLLALIAQLGAAEARHPEPRSPDLAADVVPSARYTGSPRVAEVYRMAAVVPAVLDGMYCYCRCAEHSGHYSLLDCFASDHGASCDICMAEAVTAYRMTDQGATLDDIRDEVDRTYGT